MQEFIPPRLLQPGEPLEDAVYCAECAILKQDIIGNKIGTCLGHFVQDINMPMKCQYHKNDLRLISVLIFLKSGITVYHKAIIKDLTKEIDPNLLTSFLQAINSFGEELTNEQVSLIKFQKMNIVLCKGKYSNGAMIVKGKIPTDAKVLFSEFLTVLEDSFPNFFKKEFTGKCLPEDEVDKLAAKFLSEYLKEKFHPISSSVINKACKLTCKATDK